MTTAPTSLPTATSYFDVISPFAYLALAKSVAITCRPILFAGLLQHWKHLGPAEANPHLSSLRVGAERLLPGPVVSPAASALTLQTMASTPPNWIAAPSIHPLSATGSLGRT
jgi:hypothetical protein